MKMEFIFDKEKLNKFGYKEEQCLNAIRKHFNSYKSETIKEIEKGIFGGQKKIGMHLHQLQDFHTQVGF